MKTLVVCGCSWSSRDPVYPNFEYGFLVARKLGYNYINLARCGMSNFGIRLQIDYALKHLNPDLMLINATGVNRFEILKELENKLILRFKTNSDNTIPCVLLINKLLHIVFFK